MDKRALRRLIFSTLAALSLFLAGCGSSGNSTTGPLHVAVFQAFSGPDAVDGPIGSASCIAAQQVINAAGGVRGRKLACTNVDSGSDPADAVTAANKLLADTSNLVAVLGPIEVAPSTVPIISRAKVVMLSVSGDPRYDHSTDPYFYRIVPSDDVAGAALAYWAIRSGLKHAAFVFANDVGSQTAVTALTYAYKRLGGNVAKSITLTPDQPGYQALVASLLASHPDGILTESDPQTASTFFSEFSALGGQHYVPIQVGSGDLLPDYQNALTKVLGSATMRRYFSGTSISAPSAGGPAYDAYKAALLGKGSAIPNAAQYLSQPYVASPYDATIVAALAMTAAKSTDPAVYRSYITQVSGLPRPGSVIVHTYPDGVAALKRGKHVVYVGANGPLVFNKYQNATGGYSAFRYNPVNTFAKPVAVIPPSAIAQLVRP
jgi:branched-chain amino acid transport system substrate-binding protein